MKRKLVLTGVITVLALSMSAPAFAGVWKQDDTGWWWQEDDGSYPANGWKWIDGNDDGVEECYCFDSAGYMYADQITPDGYRVNASGAWVDANGTVQARAAGAAGQNTDTQAAQAQVSLVPVNQLANLASLKKKCTDQEFQAAYDVAAEIVTPLAGLSLEDQLYGIASTLRWLVDSGQVQYSESVAHYNDPYGYLVLGLASCAGCTRTTGLCLNMLGIPYEHVNENQWSHQWCRVNVNGTYWICDAYGLYVGPEPAPYTHPYLQ